MALDLHLDNERELIDHHEEEIFELVSNSQHYPQLNWLRDNFYKDPIITPSIANDLVHELIMLKELLAKQQHNKHLLHTINRILPFFSKAYKGGKEIKCASD